MKERTPPATASGNSRPGTQQQQRTEQEKPDWRLTFGFWTELDILYHSFPTPTKPRCPALPLDSAPEWKKRLVPDDIERFLGNPAAAACLSTITSRTETDAAPAFTNYIISGGASTGKSTFASILRKTLLSVIAEQPCRFATINASECADRVLPGKLQDAVKRLDALKAGTPSFLTIERFESVTPSIQQHFFVPLLAEANLKQVFVVLLVRPDANKLAEQIKTQAVKVHLYPLPANLVRTKLLQICQQERIGYTQDGLEEIGKRCSFKLIPCMEKLHDVFIKQYFISHANVIKVDQSPADSTLSPSVSPFHLSILRMSEPLRRCPKCTLVPPCSHISLEKLYIKIDHVRALYPDNGRKVDVGHVGTTVESNIKPEKIVSEGSAAAAPQRALCPSFKQRGICANIQKLGRCCYAHPLDLQTIDTTALVPRCRVHTLPLPCLHCSNTEQHKLEARKEHASCEQLKRELLRDRQTIADLETQHYMLARDRGKTTKWGGAKKAADEQLARMDVTITSTKTKINHQEHELASHQKTLEKLQDAIAHGYSKGLGKGHGRLEVKQGHHHHHHHQQQQQRNKAGAAAAV